MPPQPPVDEIDLPSGGAGQKVILLALDPSTGTFKPVAGTLAADGHSVSIGTGSGAAPTVMRLEDGVSTNLATVAAFHAADNQNPGGTAFGLLTGGVAQLLNAAGNIDRQRETGLDGIPAQGVVTGTSQIASAFTTTSTTTVNPGTVAVTPAAMSGTNRGVPFSIQVGSVLLVDTGANQERVVVTAVTATTFSALFARAHGPTAWTIAGFVYNQARDSTLPDGAAPGGVPSGTAYFWNGALNAGAGGLEIERSAAGELDGASGAGTNVAAEYEYNSGGPGAANFDRARNLQGKGVGTNTLNGAATGGTSTFILNAGAVPAPGQPVFLLGAPAEVAYALSVAGQVVTLTANLASTHATGTSVSWDTYAGPVGPGLNGFLPTGVGIEEEALFDPVSALYYVERSATQDNAPPQNVVMENEALWNGAGMDRARTNLAVTALALAVNGNQTIDNQLNVNGHALHVVLNITALGAGTVTVAINAKTASGVVYNLLTSAAIAATGVTVLRVGPALTAAANLVANDWVPRSFQIVVTVTGTPTYSLDYNLSE